MQTVEASKHFTHERIRDKIVPYHSTSQNLALGIPNNKTRIRLMALAMKSSIKVKLEHQIHRGVQLCFIVILALGNFALSSFSSQTRLIILALTSSACCSFLSMTCLF
ncbi:hypothetical protein V6Z11_D07G179000 [Gossypium hirsutum]